MADELSGIFADRYEIEARVGSGGAAVVYRARDRKHDRTVALKVLHADLSASFGADRFQREISIAGRLTHPNILPLHDSGACDGRLFYVTPFVTGESLRDHLERERQLPIREAISIAAAVAGALHCAHAEGIVHRDIKPENILLASGQPLVADFGIARALRSQTDERLTATGVVVGTPAYMSPEQAVGEPDVDGRSDVYSLGCVLFEMLAGEPPFRASTAQALIARRVTDAAPDVRGVRAAVPDSLANVVASMLQTVPADRPRAAEVVESLTAVLSELPGLSSASLQSRRTRARRNAPGWRRTAIAGAAAVVVAAGVAVPRLRVWLRAGDIRTLAVLPLDNLTGDMQQEFVVDGLTESLISDLARVQGLRVISRTSVMQYKMMKKPLPQIAKDLGVDAVIEGSLQRFGDKLRVRASLVRARDDRNIWTDSFDGTADNLLEIEGEMGRAVAREIGGRLNGGSSTTGLHAIKAESQQAYLKGTYFAGQWRLEEAIASFQKAVAIDPQNAPAYAAMGRAFYFRAFFGEVAPAEAFGQMRRAAEAALARDESLAEAHGLMALVATHFDWNWSAAERHFQRALELSPNSAQVHHDYAHFLLAMGRAAESVNESRHAVELDPANPMLTSCLGWHSLFDDQFDRSVEQATEAQRMMPSFWAQIIIGWARIGQGRRADAVTAMRRAVTIAGNLPFARAALADALALNGERAEAARLLQALLAQARTGYVPAYDIAIVYAGLGDNDAAFEWLARALAERSMFVVHMGWDARLDPLRKDPRFGELMTRLGLPAGSRAPRTRTVATRAGTAHAL